VTTNNTPLAATPASARDPREELLYKMMVSNNLTLLSYQLERAKRPKGAKLLELLNEDFLLSFDRYMDEINGPVKLGARVAKPPAVGLDEILATLDRS
jgi:hypothetical protein